MFMFDRKSSITDGNVIDKNSAAPIIDHFCIKHDISKFGDVAMATITKTLPSTPVYFPDSLKENIPSVF